MTEEIKVGDLTIKPLNQQFKEIHPAIGVTDGVAYVGVWITCEIKGPKGKSVIKDLLWLVTSEREYVLANDEQLKNRGWRLSYKSIRFSTRWNLPDVKGFVDGSTVQPQNMLKQVINAYRKYIDFSDVKECLYHALWDIGTYFAHLFNAYPYLYIGGTKRCGKSKTLTVHSCLAHNAFFSNNMSTSSIYRLIQNARGTLLIDETEKLSSYRMSERTLEFRSILLAGYKKGGKCYRVEKTRRDMLVPRGFEVYAPKALANIRGLEDVLEDRCKTTILRRSRNKKIVNNEPDINDSKWQALRNELYIFYLTYWKEIQHLTSEFSEHNELVNMEGYTLFSNEDLDYIVGRELELWKPIFVLAMFFDKKHMCLSKFTSSSSSLTTHMLNLAVENAKQRHTENMTETGEAILIQVLQKITVEDNYYRVKLIKEIMSKQFDEEQKWLSTRWIGNALRRLGFKEKRRVGTGYEYKLNKRDVMDLAERMQILTPIMTQDNFQLVFNALHKSCQEKSLATVQELAQATHLEKDVLVNILSGLQREGKATQPRPDMWRLVT